MVPAAHGVGTEPTQTQSPDGQIGSIQDVFEVGAVELHVSIWVGQSAFVEHVWTGASSSAGTQAAPLASSTQPFLQCRELLNVPPFCTTR